MKSLVGTTLGQYRIVEQIGTGGMATVFKAYQPALDRYVAVKVLPAQHALTPGFSERFTREAKAVAQLNHPNILPIYDFGQEGDLSYIVMKYVPAGTLQDRLGQPLNLREATRFIEQIAGALDHAHRRGILHRDVKPSNVLLDEGDWALLTDFGLARMIAGETRLTATGVGMGTPAYMSPEQGKGEKVDQRTDIYSLGVILYEMVTGRVPYEAETPLAVVLKHIQGDLALPHSINPAIPEAVERVILKAMAKEPENRYGSAGEMAEALKRALETPVAPAMPVALPPKPEVVPAVELTKPKAIIEEPKRAIPWLPLAAGGGVVFLLVVATALLAALLVPRLLEPRATPVPTKIALSPMVSTIEPILTPTPHPTVTPTLKGQTLIVSATNVTSPEVGAQLSLSPGSYQVTLQSNVDLHGGIIPLKKAIIYATTDNDSHGWFWLVEEGKSTTITLTGEGLYADRVYALVVDLGSVDNSGSAILTFSGAGATKSLTISAAENVVEPGQVAVSQGLSPGTYRVTLESNLDLHDGTTSLEKVIVYATTDDDPYGWFWVAEEGRTTTIRLTGKGAYADRVYAFVLDIWPLDNSGTATLTFTKE